MWCGFPILGGADFSSSFGWAAFLSLLWVMLPCLSLFLGCFLPPPLGCENPAAPKGTAAPPNGRGGRRTTTSTTKRKKWKSPLPKWSELHTWISFTLLCITFAHSTFNDNYLFNKKGTATPSKTKRRRQQHHHTRRERESTTRAGPTAVLGPANG